MFTGSCCNVVDVLWCNDTARAVLSPVALVQSIRDAFD